MLKKTFLPLLIFIIFSCAWSIKNNKNNLLSSIVEKDKLIVGISYNSKPFGFKDSDEKIKGFEADLAKEIAKEILGSKDKIVFKNILPKDRVTAVTSGDVDIIISTMTITPERKKIVNFSVPYFTAGQAICVKKDSKIESHYDLINKKIIVILGTTGEKNIKRIVPNALIRGYIDNFEAIKAFKTGSDDAITTDDALLQGLAFENNNYIILSERLTKEPYGIAFKKSSESTSFKNRLNKILNEIKFNGTLQSLKNKWIIY